jgi:hypothetical protein
VQKCDNLKRRLSVLYTTYARDCNNTYRRVIFFYNVILLFIFSDLFHRAILLSGSPLSPLSLVRDPVYYGHQVVKLVNCSPDLPLSEMLVCLRNIPLEQLLNAQIHVPEFTTAFGPSVDGVIIDVGTAAETSRVNAQSSEKKNNINIHST